MAEVSSRPGRHRIDGALHVEVVDRANGSIRKLRRSGPVLARRIDRPLRSRIFVRALTRRDTVLIALLTAVWAGFLVTFWVWWLSPGHQVTLLGLALNSVVLLYVSGYPLMFVLGVNRLRKVDSSIPVSVERVAFVVTRAPSEPWAVVERTLTAMLRQRFPYPYDVWLCDEKPTEQITAWCRAHGVYLSTRDGRGDYHRTTWPRRTRCKEGNLAYFYDHWGYRDYDVVAQLDCDHVPEPTYLAHMVRPFADPGIGYVAAPSVCDANADESWAVRGRLHREAVLHGPIQLSHNNGRAPLCFGSHYAVRTSALKQVGGLGPELAEDFSTTFLLSAAGWNGAFAIDAEAHGDGPATFAAMLVQEFQWSRSLTTLLLGMVLNNIRQLPWRLRGRFLAAQMYYGLFVSTTLLGLALSPIAAVTNVPWVKVNYFVFIGHFWLISIWLTCLVWLLRRRGLLRPPDAPLLSYEGWLFTLTRWPYVAWGILAALLYRVRPKPLTFKVTPKQAGRLEPLRARILIPYGIVAVVSGVAALYGEWHTEQIGYVFLCLVAALSYTVVLVVVPLLHASDAARSTSTSFMRACRETIVMPLVLAAVVATIVGVAISYFPSFVMLTFGQMPIFG